MTDEEIAVITEIAGLLDKAASLLRAMIGGADDDYLNIELAKLELGAHYGKRLQEAFKRYPEWNGGGGPLITVRDLVRVKEDRLLRMPNVGSRSIEHLRGVLAQHGLRFGMDL